MNSLAGKAKTHSEHMLSLQRQSAPAREGEGEGGGRRSVDVALLEGALAGLGGLSGRVVLAQLRVAVGLGALQQRSLGSLHVLWLTLKTLPKPAQPREWQHAQFCHP